MPPKKAPRKKKASPPCEDSEKPPKRQKSLTTKAKTEELCLTAVVIALDQQDHLVKDPSFNGKSAKEANIAVAEAIVGREVYNVNSKYRFVVIPCHEDSETNSFAKEFHAPSPDLVRYVSVQLPTLTDFTEDVSHYIKVAINTLAKEISNLPDHIKAKEVSIILLRGGRRPNVVFTLEGEAQQDVLAIMKEKLGPDSQFTFIGAVPHYDEELHPEGVRKNDHGSLYEGLSYEKAYQNASTFNTHTVNPRSYSHTFTIGGNFNDGNPKLCSFEVQAIAIRSKFKLDLKRRYTDAQGKEVVRISRITKGVLKSDFDLAGEDEADDQDNPESSDAKEVKQDIEKVAAYKYGSELIPVYKQDEDDMYPEEDKHLNLLYFAKVSDIKPHCLLSCTTQYAILPSKKDKRDYSCFVNLVTAMVPKEDSDSEPMAAIVRFKSAVNAKNRLAALIPEVPNDSDDLRRPNECPKLIMVTLPFYQDYRAYCFPSLDDVQIKDSQATAMSLLVSEMTLRDHEDYKPEMIPNPKVQKTFKNLIRLYKDDPLEADVVDHEAENKELLKRLLLKKSVLERCEPIFASLKIEFPLKGHEDKVQVPLPAKTEFKGGRKAVEAEVYPDAQYGPLRGFKFESLDVYTKLLEGLKPLEGRMAVADTMKCIKDLIYKKMAEAEEAADLSRDPVEWAKPLAAAMEFFRFSQMYGATAYYDEFSAKLSLNTGRKQDFAKKLLEKQAELLAP